MSQSDVEILRLMAAGWSIRETSERMCLSYRTAMRRIQQLMTLLDAHSTKELAAKALQKGLI